TLFGVAARNAILLISHVEHLIEQEGHDWPAATLRLATRERVTPILMTALVTGLGVAPLAISTGQAGREIQGPMAIVILGGLVTSTIASLVLLPALTWRYGRAPASEAASQGEVKLRPRAPAFRAPPWAVMAAGLAFASGAAQAEPAHIFRLPSEPVDTALVRFGVQAGVSIGGFPVAGCAGFSRGVIGVFTPS